jgi:hypothetical protein
MVRTSVAFAFLIAGFAMAWPTAEEMSAVSRCSDMGGSYDYGTGHCDLRLKHPSFVVWQRHGVTLLGSIALGAFGCLLLFRRRPD